MSFADDQDRDDLTDDLAEYRSMYLDETEEQLDDLIETMLALEQSPQDERALNSAFRLLHSMKGAAGMMGFDQITVLTHHLETRFERLRSRRIELDSVTMNLTLRCIDFLRECNDRMRDDQELGSPDVLLAELHELEERVEQEVQQAAAVATAPAPIPDVTDSRLTQAQDNSPKITPAAPTEAPVHHVAITFDADAASPIETIHELQNALARTGEIVATRPEIDELSTTADLSSFDVIVQTSVAVDELAHVALVSGVVHVEIRIPRDSDSPPLAVADAIPSQPKPTPETEPTTLAPGDERSTPDQSIGTPTASKAAESMRVDIDRLDSLMNLAGELVVNRAQFRQVNGDFSPSLRKASTVNRSREFCERLRTVIDHFSEQNKRDDIDDVELPTMIKELESGLQLLQSQTAQMEESRRCFVRLDEAIDQLSRVSDSLQRGVLGTRMVPVGPLFSRFRRTVRDLSRERNKKVHLVLRGESTELDKRMIDALGDPLVHLVRNSLDHGLEDTLTRESTGKPSNGTITLTAKHLGNHVYVIVQDDGGGIRPDKIRARLCERGILQSEQAKALSDKDVIDYIWHPGFSTAEAVSDISGRGVGMDVVRSRIKELSGTIEIDTVAGEGTTFTLKLPLTLAIISSLLVRIRDIVFSVPMDDVREIVSVPRDGIISINNRKTFEVRGEYVPLIDVNEIFHWNDTHTDTLRSDKSSQAVSDTIEIVILQSSGKTIGLAVDALIGSQDVVIKSLTDNFIGVPGLAGASILGDGTVALMLDVSAVVRISIQGSIAAAGLG